MTTIARPADTDPRRRRSPGKPFTTTTGRAAGIRSGRVRYVRSVAKRLLEYGVDRPWPLVELLLDEALRAERKPR